MQSKLLHREEMLRRLESFFSWYQLELFRCNRAQILPISTTILTFSFLNNVMADQFNGGEFALNLVNPISSELTDMRPSIIPNLLSAVQKNVNIGAHDISFFEIGPIFKGDSPNEQISTITGIRYGDKIKKDWQKTEQ